MSIPILPGSEPWSHEAGRAGALCIHGFTGNPSSMRGVAEAFAAAGFSVELPRLPGHGTTVEDMLTTTWDDWSTEVEASYQRLAARTDQVVVAGLSMGGALTIWTAIEHPEVAGIVCINAATQPQAPEILDMVRGMVDEGQLTLPAIGGDIADPDGVESSYAATPLPPLLSLMDGLAEMQSRLSEIACPVLILNSPNDHVVEPANSDHLAASVSGPVERVTLERSYHVATLDYDKELIFAASVAFGQKVTASVR